MKPGEWGLGSWNPSAQPRTRAPLGTPLRKARASGAPLEANVSIGGNIGIVTSNVTISLGGVIGECRFPL